MEIRARGFARAGGLENYLKQLEFFHGYLAPGAVMGGFMVDWACEQLRDAEMVNAIAETSKCLPDAIQLLTPCSLGNGWMKILKGGRFAITLYDKEKLEGIRISVDREKLKNYPLIDSWFWKRVSKKDNPLEPLNEEITRAGRDILKAERVKVASVIAAKEELAKSQICSKCGEPFRSRLQGRCDFCLSPYYIVTRNP